MTTLVCIHGRGQYGKNPDALRRKWAAGLNFGLTTVGRKTVNPDKIVFPFYGDLLEAKKLQAQQSGASIDLESAEAVRDQHISPLMPEKVAQVESDLLKSMADQAGVAELQQEGFEERILDRRTGRQVNADMEFYKLGGIEDMQLGFHNVWKYHYSPGLHENVTVGEIVINGDVWKELSTQHQEIIKSAANETFLVWWTKWQRQNADAVTEMQQKHGVQILRTPTEILLTFIKKWDEIAAAEGAKNPFFKKVHDSQKAYASAVVPYKRSYFPPYSFMANYYFPVEK